MAGMSGAALSSPERPGPRSSDSSSAAPELFTGLVVSNPSKGRAGYWLPASVVGHTLIIALLILVPILWPSDPPEHFDYIRALIYNPPPPPPPPLPKGRALMEKSEPAKPVTPEVKPETPKMVAQIEKPEDKPLEPETRPPDTEQAGSESGSDMGVPEGMDIGVEGGVVGGVPGGVLGGVIGGTGDGPVLDYDQPPRLIKNVKPQYPQDAFIKKIEGTVEIEILIDSTGRVVNARVVHSIPLLDAAALATVKQWLFAPAVKGGRPVATIARAPVAFRIY
jgi:periplasmic protein TonB